MPRNRPSGTPPENPGSDGFMGALQRMWGDLEDDRSRRRGRRRRRNDDDDDLKIGSLVKKRPQHSFDDVAGNEESKKELREIARAIQDPEVYTRFGAELPRGILMTGKPGCGKTYLTGALANTLNAPFYHVTVSEVTSMWFGQSEKNLQKVFTHAEKYVNGEIDIDEEGEVTKWDADEWARNREAELLDQLAEEDEEREVESGHQNRERVRRRRRLAEIRQQIRQEREQREQADEARFAIIFFDEIDALGAARENTPFQGGVSNRIVSVLLDAMDGLDSCTNIIVVACTNRPEAVDNALRRAGRFDRIIKVKKPDRKTRAEIFRIHFKKAEERAKREFVRCNFTELAIGTRGLVGADIAEIVRKACQEQAIKYREAEPEEREKHEYLETEDVLDIVKDYRTNMRKKDPYSTDGTIGFHHSKRNTEELVEEELDDDDLEVEEDA